MCYMNSYPTGMILSDKITTSYATVNELTLMSPIGQTLGIFLSIRGCFRINGQNNFRDRCLNLSCGQTQLA